MTDTLVTPPSATVTVRARLRVTGPRVVLSEWTKFRSLRSTVYTVLIAVVLMVGLGALFTAIAAGQPGGLTPGQSAVSTSLTGTFFAQLAIGVLGVLLISGEYSTGMIRSSLTAVPRRLPMLWAKLAVFAGVVFLTMLLASVAAFLVGQLLLSGQHLDASLSDPGALRSVLGAALYVTVAGVTALVLGALLRKHRGRDHHLRRRVLRDPATDPAVARIVDGPLRAIPPRQHRRSADRRHLRRVPSPGALDRIRRAVRIRGGADRVRRLAAPPRRRLTRAEFFRPGSTSARERFSSVPRIARAVVSGNVRT